MTKKYEVTVYDTCSRKIVIVPLEEDVYTGYRRSGWKIEHNECEARKYEIPLSSLFGSEENGCENFKEFRDCSSEVEEQILKTLMVQKLKEAIKTLTPEEKEMVVAIYFEEESIRSYAKRQGVPYMTIYNRNLRTLDKLKNFFKKEKIIW